MNRHIISAIGKHHIIYIYIYIVFSANLAGNSFAATCAQAKLIGLLVNASCWKVLGKQKQADSQITRLGSSCSKMARDLFSRTSSFMSDDTPEKSTPDKITPEKTPSTLRKSSSFESPNVNANVDTNWDTPLEDDVRMNLFGDQDDHEQVENPVKKRRIRGKTSCSATGYQLAFPCIPSGQSFED